MAHQCTNCGHVFPDGSKEMLSGCPSCGGNKFQFKPGAVDSFPSNESPAKNENQEEPETSSTPSPSESPSRSDSSSTRSEPTQPSASADWPAAERSARADKSPPETAGFGRDAEVLGDSATPDPTGEAPAQSTARSDVVSPEEVTAAGPTESDKPVSTTTESSETHTAEPAEDAPAPAGDETNIDQLRQELNSQFESIRIVSPGQYELNLMELYDRDEYIISLREDGRYVIDVPDGWGTDGLD